MCENRENPVVNSSFGWTSFKSYTNIWFLYFSAIKYYKKLRITNEI